MFTLRRPAVLVPLVVALVLGLVGGLAFSSRDSGHKVVTQGSRNCPPIARTDAVATRPNEAVVVDVLANDTDSEDDALQLSIVEVAEGTASVDDAGTPDDPRDDALLYTPADPPSPVVNLSYRVEDTTGNQSTAKVAVAVNEAATLPDGLASADRLASVQGVAARCVERTTEESDDGLVASGPVAPPAADAPAGEEIGTVPVVGSASSRTSRSATTTTMTIGGKTTTNSTVAPGKPNTGNPPPPPSNSSTSSPPTSRPTTTRPPSDGEPPPCDYNDPTGQSCRDYANGHRSTTTSPTTTAP